MLFNTKGHSFERDIIMLNVRWYLNYKLSYRDLAEMVSECGIRGAAIPIVWTEWVYSWKKNSINWQQNFKMPQKPSMYTMSILKSHKIVNHNSNML